MQALRDNELYKDEGVLTLVQSYIAWWDMAGFDQVVDNQTVNWLEEKAQITPKKNESPLQSRDISINVADKQNFIQPQTVKPTVSIITQDSWPKTLSELHEAIKSGAALPGNIYGGRHVAPYYLKITKQKTPPNHKTIMLISDFPNTQDLDEKSLLSGKEYQLIVNMLTAANIQNHNIYCASLASTQPIYDELPEQDLPLIHAFIHQHIKILDPDIVISLGSAACNALLNAELMKSRKNLHYFNLNDKKQTLLTTFHPKTLLANPNLKEKAWRDLQRLMKKDIL